MGAEAAQARHRRGIQQRGRLGAAARVREVAALGVEGRAVPRRRQQHVADGDGAQARAVDDRLRRDGILAAGAVTRSCRDGVLAAGPSPGSRLPLNARDDRVQHLLAAALLKTALQIRHERVRVDDARGGRLEHAGLGAHIRLAPADLVAAEELHRHVDRPRELMQPLQLLHLLRVLRDDPLLGAPVRDVRVRRELVQHLLAAQAEFRLQRVGPVVDARVDDFRVAAARLGPHGVVPLDQKRRCPCS